MQRGAKVAQMAHNHQGIGSSPIAAPTFKKMKNIFYDDAPADGNGTPPAPAATAQPAAAAPPSAATTVVNGKTEREILLEQQLESERAGRRTAETRASEVERNLQNERERQRLATETARPKNKREPLTVLEAYDEGDGQNNED
jgi:hypothetical protein